MISSSCHLPFLRSFAHPSLNLQVLLPLVSTSDPLCLELLPDTVPPKVWISADQIDALQGKCYCTDVLRRGKQLCLVLEKRNKGKAVETQYLFLHMVRSRDIQSCA